MGENLETKITPFLSQHEGFKKGFNTERSNKKTVSSSHLFSRQKKHGKLPPENMMFTASFYHLFSYG
jgi:hypothetical protein